jgi:Fe-S-cluster containining protein
MLSPYDIIRLKRATRLTTTELVSRDIVEIERVPLKKAFGFGPVADMLDMFGLSQSDIVPVAFLGVRKDESGKHVCRFLSAANGKKRLCSIYEHRPGMCRLHPLGCITIAGKRRWIYRKPLCETDKAPEHTVEDWLQISHMRPFMTANARYLKWIRELLENTEYLPDIPERRWKALGKILYDFDTVNPITEKMTMDRIEEMFREWLSQTKHPKKRGG